MNQSSRFSLIKEISINDSGSWNNIFLTFDIDWACDDVLNDTIDLVEKNNSTATFFITHDTPVLSRLRGNQNYELGIHPNFNFLLNGIIKNGASYKQIISSLLEIVPEAKSVRSHSLAQSSNIIQAFSDFGLTHDSNHFISASADTHLKPWKLWNGLIKCPFFWEDDVHVMEDSIVKITDLQKYTGLKIFDFHPIHVFLNTESMDRYEKTRHLHNNPKELIKYRFDGYGTRNRLLELLELTKNNGIAL